MRSAVAGADQNQRRRDAERGDFCATEERALRRK
jgi:hypothetical protein